MGTTGTKRNVLHSGLRPRCVCVCVCSIKWVPRVPSVVITLFVSVCVGVKRVPRVPSVLEGAGER